MRTPARFLGVCAILAATLATAGCGPAVPATAAPTHAKPTATASTSGAQDPGRPDTRPRLTTSHAAAAARAAEYRYLNDWVPPTWLPGHLFVVYYGNPLNGRMGILGQGSTRSMLAKLRAQAKAYAPLSGPPVQPALDLVAVVAQGSPQPDHTYRLRMPASLIDAESRIAQENHMPLFLDVQVGHSTVKAEVKALAPYLARPWVELALDPEFDMPPGELPGRWFGVMHAAEINWAADYLSKLIAADHLPQKVLVVHQFTATMLPDWQKIHGAPGVALVLDMDGFGGQGIKKANYGLFVRDHDVAGRFGGIKLFYTQDHPLFTPAQVMQLKPTPSLVMYQ